MYLTCSEHQGSPPEVQIHSSTAILKFAYFSAAETCYAGRGSPLFQGGGGDGGESGTGFSDQEEWIFDCSAVLGNY